MISSRQTVNYYIEPKGMSSSLPFGRMSKK